MSLLDDASAEERAGERARDRRRSERETTAAGEPRKPGLELRGGGLDADLTLPIGAELGDLEELIRSRGLEPADWRIEAVRANEWEALAYGGGPDDEPRIVKLRQLRVTLRNRRLDVHPPSDVAKRHKPRKRRPSSKRPRLVVVCGDQHAPYHDPELHRAFLRWLADVRPDEGVLAGDTLDLPSVSRFRQRPRWNAAVNECLRAAFPILSDYRDASPGTRWRKLRGNHDDRIETRLIDKEPELAHVRPAGEPEDAPHAYSIRRLLNLDRLGIELVGDELEEWARVELELAPGVHVRHHPPRTPARAGRTIVAGHTHKQAVRYVTSGTGETTTVVEVGTMARIREGLGYAEDPDWQAGFATVALWPDGTSSFDLATWRDGALTWRGERYE